MPEVNLTNILGEIGAKQTPVVGNPAVARSAAMGGAEGLKKMLASLSGGEIPVEGIVSKGKGAIGKLGKGGGMGPVLALLALQMMLSGGIQGVSEVASLGQQTESLEKRTAKLTPESALASLQIPGAVQENQAALAAFMNAIGGDQAGTVNLASGETRV